MGLAELYQATHDERHLAAALDLHGQVEARFADAEAGGFFLTDRTAEALLVRPKPVYDGAVPSGAAVAALNRLRLGRVAGRADWEDAARHALASSPDIAAFPDAHTVWMAALAFGPGPSQEVVIVGERRAADIEAMLAAVRTVHAPNALVLLPTPGTGAAALSALVPFTEAQTASGGTATAYVCSDHDCHEPTTDPARAAALLAAAVR